MNYRFLFFFIFLSCVPIENKNIVIFDKSYTNAGFTLVYNETEYEKKNVTKKINEGSLVIFQKNLKKKTSVKITNILNNKSIIAVVGENSKYPSFYNSVISKKIADEIDLNPSEPYIEILEINENTIFVAGKAKTFDEEKKVAEKAPVLEIGIKNLIPEDNKIDQKSNKIEKFSYVIKIADFYYFESANLLKKRIKKELNVNEVKINELSKTKFRVYLGPYDSLKKIKKGFDKILELNFENIEIIKLWKLDYSFLFY